MSVRACLPGLVADGKISQDQADEAAALFDQLLPDFRRQFGDQAAEAMASDATLKQMEAAASRKRYLAALTVRTRQRMEMDMAGYNGGHGSDGNGGGPIDPRSGPAFLGSDGRAGYSNVEGRWKAVRGRAHGMIDKILADHSSNLLGEVRHRAQLADIAREAFGEDSGNANAKELADAWLRTAEYLRQRFNAAGGDIGKIERWGLPQTHDSRQVRAAGFDAWRNFIVPLLDRGKMIDQVTGRPFGDGALEMALDDVFQTIRSEGWKDRAPGGMGSGALANRRGDARFLIFRNADAWQTYAEKFGAGNPFDAMMGHIDGMSRDIAMMEVLGPNPTATVEWLKGTLQKSAEMDKAANSKAVDRVKPALGKIERQWNEISGVNNRAENRQLSLAFSSVRSFLTSAKLGGAMLSAITDSAFHRSALAFNGLPQARMIGSYAKLMRPGSIEDQRLAVRLGLIAEEWSHRTAMQNRFLNEELSGEVSRRLAEGVLRASGLARWTQAGRWAFGMQFLGHMTEERAKAFNALEPAFREAMQRYGISASDWDAIRATPLENDRGVDWIKPQNIADQALGDRVLEMIGRETDFAVPVPDLNTRATLHSVMPKGTLIGELGRSIGLFKSFGVSVLMMQGERIMQQTAGNAARYAAGLFIGSTLMGGLSILLKDVAAGKDPRQMDSGKFWMQAALQGGGFGIFGDFLNSTTNREQNGIATTLAGPVVSTGQDIVNVATNKNHAAAALRLVRGNLPGGTLWYARLAFDRMVIDEIRQATDPNYARSWKRMAKFAADNGTQYWWAPGRQAPERAPDWANALGDMGKASRDRAPWQAGASQ